MPLFFFLSGCVLTFLATAFFGLAFVNRPVDSSDPFTWKPLLEQVNNRGLNAETLFLPLTGVASADALSTALDKGNFENAYAIIAFDPDLSDPARIGALLQMGERYAAAKDIRKAVSCYQSAALLATLTPAISDLARIDTYQQASSGLRNIGASGLARWITDQSYLVAQYSPSLLRDARTRRLEQIAEAYAALGANSLAAQARAKSAESAAGSDTASVQIRSPFIPNLGGLPASAEVDSAKAARAAAAQQLANDLLNSPNGLADLPADTAAQLGDALIAEDGARQVYYDKQIASTQNPLIQMALIRDKVSWFALKYRVARGGFGSGIVSDWERDPAAIADSWGNAWSDWFQLYERQAGVVTKPQDPDQALEDVVRRELVAARWGWYNAVAENELTANLGDVTQRVMKLHSPVLHLDLVTRSKKSTFLLVPDELYGQNEQSLPK